MASSVGVRCEMSMRCPCNGLQTAVYNARLKTDGGISVIPLNLACPIEAFRPQGDPSPGVFVQALAKTILGQVRPARQRRVVGLATTLIGWR